MPIYEFYCPDNHTVYQFLARTLGHGDKTPRCPENEKFRMERRVSRFAFLRGAKEDDNDPFANMDDAKMEALMADMERDMSGMDENNPDPRQLGHFMRKMTDLMGDKAPAEMREIIRRLEAGEDPEKLEEQFGDLGGEDGTEGGDFLTQTVKRLRAGFRAPKRDAKLYELRDYLA
ncbi:cytochrome C [Phragmitibacter flavus]|uniref:Cytochrome C n=1 Tax=Phragmitibacter flavus TaxID=2576071 RepID=A0A5R8KGY9_9BACT|nr:cytochrome C [Phragmitibacter flavus]TLD71235.1 cytochrome C [Phragmitibacter flavus]